MSDGRTVGMKLHDHTPEDATLFGAITFHGGLVADACGTWVITRKEEELLLLIESRKELHA